jgi:hypothetical protein
MPCRGHRQNANRAVARTQITIVLRVLRIRTALMPTIAGLDVIRIRTLGRERRKSADRQRRKEKVRSIVARLRRVLRRGGTIVRTRHRNGVL